MEKDSQLRLEFPDICGKKVEGDFHGGNVTPACRQAGRTEGFYFCVW